ncbi:MAG: homoserine kinase, partial [Rubrivivax sp.]
MAVYTEVGLADAQSLLHDRLGLGDVTDLQGIRSGIENTNYYANTERGQWVLTLFERLAHDQLPYYLRLMEHLAHRGIPVPAPQPDARGELVHSLCGKPAAVVTRLPGSHRLAPGVDHARQVGAMLARMHVASSDFALHQPHLRGLDWWIETVPVVLPHLDGERARLLETELAYQRSTLGSDSGLALPRGAIHADLFRDNAMFDDTAGEDRLCGFFDFYFAGTETLLFDVATCLNDWCCDMATGALDPARANAFMTAYTAVRPLAAVEHELFNAQLRAAAFRFWLSRLWDWHLPRSAALLTPKDPGH